MAEQGIGVEVSEEVRDLKKYQAGYPDSCTASKPWKDDLRQHGLDLKEEERAEKEGAAPQGERARAGRADACSAFSNKRRVFDDWIHGHLSGKHALRMRTLHVTSGQGNLERQKDENQWRSIR